MVQFFWEKEITKLEHLLGVKEKPGVYEYQFLSKAESYKKIFRSIPWILWIAICNSVSMNACHKDSDIDLFIITKRNRIWTTRVIITLILSLLWERKNEKKHRDKFCLSFFITEDFLDLSSLALEKDIYLAYWIENHIPLIEKENMFQKFKDANTWYQIEGKERKAQKGKEEIISRKSHIFSSFCEYIFQKIFLKKTKKSFQKLWKPFWIIIEENILKFHNKDKRKEIQEKIYGK